LRAAREQTFLGTRRYVRRQRSWFRRDHRVHWLDVGATDPANRARIVDATLQAWRQVP
jgi:tRNA dimethylallyltransferase